MTAEQLLINARCRLQIRSPFFGFLSIGMIWRESEMRYIQDEKQRRLSAKVTSEGIIVNYYAPWVLSKSLEELFGAIQHVTNHLICLHSIRRSGRRIDYWDRASDLASNGTRKNPRIGYIREGHTTIMPYDDLLFIPEDWPENESAEYFYDRMLKECPPDEPVDPKHPGICPYESIDSHDEWSQSDISVDEVRQMISERAKDAAEKSVGNVPGHLKQALESLREPVVSWREIIRRFFGVHVGNRRPTYSRANRRNNSFGVKGISHHACSEMMVIVDTSGSITEEELKQFFTEIDSCAAKCKVWVLMWDAAFNGVFRYRVGSWKTIMITGGGGTDMAAPIKYLEDNGLIKDVQVMLTDGEVGGLWPKPRSFPMLFCITTNTSDLPEWGTCLRLNVR